MSPPHCTVAKLDFGVLPVPDGVKQSHHILGKDGRRVRFQNPYPSAGPTVYPLPTALKLLRGSITGTMPSPSIKNAADVIPVSKQPPHLIPPMPSQTLRATWLGHAAYHVTFPSPSPDSRATGLRVLFDPVFESRCSGVQWAGPKRFTPAPCTSSEVAPNIDIICISHSHYDHLSYNTISEIARQNPGVHFFVGLGLKSWFVNQCSILDKNVTELDWWEGAELNLSRAEETIKAQISCLPSQHASGRTLGDKDTTLWASWSIESSGKKLWFAGDTGYRVIPSELEHHPDLDSIDDYGKDYEDLPRCPSFKEIGELRGPFDLGLIPIGAYKPRWMWSSVHANPRDAVEIFKDTKCKKAMGIHWGTWVLTSEEIDEPPRLLREALKSCGIEEKGVFDVCAIGETREF
ncbi:Beta-lactamase superfamily domain containing protein [Rhypophila sp. PSN 637]